MEIYAPRGPIRRPERRTSAAWLVCPVRGALHLRPAGWPRTSRISPSPHQRLRELNRQGRWDDCNGDSGRNNGRQSPASRKDAKHAARPSDVSILHDAACQVLGGGVAATFDGERAGSEGRPERGRRTRLSDVRRRRATNRQRGAKHLLPEPGTRLKNRRYTNAMGSGTVLRPLINNPTRLARQRALHHPRRLHHNAGRNPDISLHSMPKLRRQQLTLSSA